MDLSTLLSNIDAHKYVTVKDFLQEVDLIWKNALEYNPDRDPSGKHGLSFIWFHFVLISDTWASFIVACQRTMYVWFEKCLCFFPIRSLDPPSCLRPEGHGARHHQRPAGWELREDLSRNQGVPKQKRFCYSAFCSVLETLRLNRNGLRRLL